MGSKTRRTTTPERKAPEVKPELIPFARALHAATQAKGMSNSDLAREIWGETKDSKGYAVARNRDRIAVYLAAKGAPEAATLHKMAEILEVPKGSLADEMMTAVVDRTRREFSIDVIEGDARRVHIVVDTIMPLSIALDISKLYEKAKALDAPVPGIDTDLPDDDE